MIFDSNTFLIPYAEGDVTIKIRDIDGNLIHDLLPSNVVYVGVNKKNLNIKTYANNKIISLPFKDMVDAQDALGKLQDLIEFIKTHLPDPTDGDLHDVVVFSASASVWDINHNLGKFPSVTTINFNNQEIEGLVEYISISHLTVSWNKPISGKAYLN